ncbi:MAG: M15 family metallopeptidase [Beijerinckiaceae bacterium]|nr:M15 family metallopeptidase [Beijerinckiaceae bacterium]
MTIPPFFTDLAALIPSLILDIRYASAGNFIGEPVDGYQAPRGLLTQEAARALAAVQDDLAASGLGLKVFDAYRPARAVRHFVRWARDADDIRGKAEYYPHLDKPDLFRLGFIAADSAHCRGSTVDLTLIALASGDELPMGSAFDFFGPESTLNYSGLSPNEFANRERLHAAMAARGFEGFAQEWWHFTLRDEPYPATRFDFPIIRDEGGV